MRDIKFRAWSKVFNRFAPEHAEYHFDGENSHLHFDCFNGNFDTDVWNFSECELMQYTGLTDINGIEIYECDIVREMFLGFKFHVQFNTVTAQFEAIPIDGNPCHSIPLFERDFTVIGNIYENPELLESL